MKQWVLTVWMTVCLLCLAACAGTSGQNPVPSGEQAPSSTVTSAAGETSQAPSDEPSVITSDSSEDDRAPASTPITPESPEPSSGNTRDTVVVYFSATGTTKGVAERIASVTNADLFEIVPVQPYSAADLDWNDPNSRTSLETNDPSVRPAIANDTVRLENYTTVYLGYPIWWGDAPRIMSTFVETHRFDGMTVIPFCTSGGSGIGRSGSNLASQAGSGHWLGGDRLRDSISEDEIQNWVNSLH